MTKGNTQVLALTDSVANNALVPTEDISLSVGKIAWGNVFSGKLADKVGIFAVRNEADVLTVRLGGVDKAVSAILRTWDLSRFPSGKRVCAS